MPQVPVRGYFHERTQSSPPTLAAQADAIYRERTPIDNIIIFGKLLIDGTRDYPSQIAEILTIFLFFMHQLQAGLA
jgi:hypothetical protein